MYLSYLSCLSLKVDILPCGNLPLISMQVGWEELEREVGTCSYKGLGRQGRRGRKKSKKQFKFYFIERCLAAQVQNFLKMKQNLSSGQTPPTPAMLLAISYEHVKIAATLNLNTFCSRKICALKVDVDRPNLQAG